MNETRFRFTRDNLPADLKDVATWPTVDISQMSTKELQIYLKFEEAVKRYVQNEEPLDVIEKDTGMDRTEIWRKFHDCMRITTDGSIEGLRGLIPYRRFEGHKRRNPFNEKYLESTGGRSGLFMQVLEEYPEIKELIDDLFLRRVRKGLIHESRMPVKSLVKVFIDECERVGLKKNKQYPFGGTSNYRAQSSMSRYLRKLFEQEYEKAVRARLGKRAAQSVGDGKESTVRVVTKPLERVEADGHLLNARFVILVPDLIEGGFKTFVVHRLWIIVLIDVNSRAVLGYYLSFNRKYSQFDVVQAVKKSIQPWEPIQNFTIKGMSYRDGGGLPSGVIPEMAWALFDELWVDNDKAHLATYIVNNVKRVVGCALNFGPIGTPERRPIIESFFNSLEKNNIERIPSFTGKNALDDMKEDPEGKALTYRISLQHLKEILDVTIADYNATPHTNNNYLTPMEKLENYCRQSGDFIRHVPEQDRHNIEWLNIVHAATIRGVGRRPYINYKGCRYKSEQFAQRVDLCGKKITLYINPDDIRTVKAYLGNDRKGEFLGILTAEGAWGKTPHTLRMRQVVMHLRKRKIITYTDNDDPIMVLMAHLSEGAKTNINDRARYIEFLEYFDTTFKATDKPQSCQTSKPANPEKEQSANGHKKYQKIKSMTY